MNDQPQPQPQPQPLLPEAVKAAPTTLSQKRRLKLKQNSRWTPWYNKHEFNHVGQSLRLAIHLFPPPSSASTSTSTSASASASASSLLSAAENDADPDFDPIPIHTHIPIPHYNEISNAIKRISIWRKRTNHNNGNRLPHCIEITSSLAETLLQDAVTTATTATNNHHHNVSSMSLRLMYASTIIRGVNGIADSMSRNRSMQVQLFGNSNSDYNFNSQSISNLCAKIGLPSWVVDVRHDASHQELPSLIMLRLSCLILLEFMVDKYWFVIMYPGDTGDTGSKGNKGGTRDAGGTGGTLGGRGGDNNQDNDNNGNDNGGYNSYGDNDNDIANENKSSENENDTGWNYLVNIEKAVRNIIMIEENERNEKMNKKNNDKSKDNNNNEIEDDNNKDTNGNNKNSDKDGDDDDNGEDDKDKDDGDDSDDDLTKYGAYSIFMEKKRDKKGSKRKKMKKKKQKEKQQRKRTALPAASATTSATASPSVTTSLSATTTATVVTEGKLIQKIDQCVNNFMKNVAVDAAYDLLLSFLVWEKSYDNYDIGSSTNNNSSAGFGVLITSQTSNNESRNLLEVVRKQRSLYGLLVIVPVAKAWPGFIVCLLVNIVECIFILEDGKLNNDKSTEEEYVVSDLESHEQRQNGNNESTPKKGRNNDRNSFDEEVEWKLNILFSWVEYLLSNEFYYHLGWINNVNDLFGSKKGLKKMNNVNKENRSKKNQWPNDQMLILESSASLDILKLAQLPLNSLCDRCSERQTSSRMSPKILSFFEGILKHERIKCNGITSKRKIQKQVLYSEGDKKRKLDEKGALSGAHFMTLENMEAMLSDSESKEDYEKNEVLTPWKLCSSWDVCAIGTLPGRVS